MHVTDNNDNSNVSKRVLFTSPLLFHFKADRSSSRWGCTEFCIMLNTWWQNLFYKVQRNNHQISELNWVLDKNRTSQNISQSRKSIPDAVGRLIIIGVGFTSPEARCVQCRCLHLSYSLKTLNAQQGKSRHSSLWLIWPTLAVYLQIGWFIPQKHPCLPNTYTSNLDDYPNADVSAAVL